MTQRMPLSFDTAGSSQERAGRENEAMRRLFALFDVLATYAGPRRAMAALLDIAHGVTHVLWPCTKGLPTGVVRRGG